MSRYILFVLSCLLLSAIVVVGLLVLYIPKQAEGIITTIEEYEYLEKEDYKFVETKQVEITNVQKTYEVTPDELDSYIKTYQYVPGNVNPFTVDTSSSDDNNDDGDSSNDTGTINNQDTGSVDAPPTGSK